MATQSGKMSFQEDFQLFWQKTERDVILGA